VRPAPGPAVVERLNLFQRQMRRWRELHPYNPVHVLRIAAPLDLPRLQACLAARLQAARLGELAIDARGRHLRRGPGRPEPRLAVVPPRPDAAAAIDRAIESAFNEPFAADDPTPLRGFVVEDGGAFHLGLAYDHYLAGGDAVARLLTDTALAYLGMPAPGARPPEAVPTYRRLFLGHPGWALRTLVTLPQSAAATRRAHRPPLPAGDDGADGFVSLRLDAARTAALHAALRRWGVTLNDALLAALMLAVAPLAEARRQQPRRREIALASIMNIRHDFGPAAQCSTAPYLAALRVGHRVPSGIGMERLARELHVQTAASKREHRYLQSLMGLGLSALLWPLLTPARRRRLYLKHHPVWGGVTTLNPNRLWRDADPAAVARLDYRRGVPTGPLCPMVLAATSTHDVLHLGLAYRRAAFTPQQAARVLDAVGRWLARPDGPQPPAAAARAPGDDAPQTADAAAAAEAVRCTPAPPLGRERGAPPGGIALGARGHR
jgi:hypothetical protein